MRKKSGIILSLLLLTAVVFTALPKLRVNNFLNPTGISLPAATGSDLQIQENKNTEEYNLEKFETPVYFTIFKFILNISPFKSSEKVSDELREKKPDTRKVIYADLSASQRV
jgi:hypothetical protein